jgi:hypothetical protein
MLMVDEKIHNSIKPFHGIPGYYACWQYTPDFSIVLSDRLLPELKYE